MQLDSQVAGKQAAAGSQHPACLEGQQVLAAALVAVQVGGAGAQAQPQRVKASVLHARGAELCGSGAGEHGSARDGAWGR